MTDTTTGYERSNFQSDQEVRWCPGCGDYTILASVQTLAGIDIDPSRNDTCSISHRVCRTHFPYYMNTYGMRSIHGHAPAMAWGWQPPTPELTRVGVGSATAMCRSAATASSMHCGATWSIKILLFNNQIYGPYSPT